MTTRYMLAAKIREIHTSAQSGVLTVVTEQGRSVSLRFFEGRITRLQSRGSDMQNALGQLIHAEDLKFNFIESSVAEEPDLLPALYVVDLLEKGPTEQQTAIDTTETAAVEDITVPQANRPGVDSKTMQRVLSEISLVHIGPIADLVVEQAISENNTFELIINAIAENIPSETDARAFRNEARQRIKDEMNSE